MSKELEEAIVKLSELKLEDRAFVIKFINEAHKQDKAEHSNKVIKNIEEQKDKKKLVYTSRGTIVKDSRGRALYLGDRVRIESPGSVEGVKFVKGDLGYFVGYSNDFCVITADKLRGNKYRDYIHRIQD